MGNGRKSPMGGSFGWAGLFGLVAVAMLLQGVQQIACYQVAVDLQDLNEQRVQLEERREMLEVTLRELTSISRMEVHATKLGLVPERGATVVYQVAPDTDGESWMGWVADAARRVGDAVLPVQDAYAFE